MKQQIAIVNTELLRNKSGGQQLVARNVLPFEFCGYSSVSFLVTLCGGSQEVAEMILSFSKTAFEKE